VNQGTQEEQPVGGKGKFDSEEIPLRKDGERVSISSPKRGGPKPHVEEKLKKKGERGSNMAEVEKRKS